MALTIRFTSDCSRTTMSLALDTVLTRMALAVLVGAVECELDCTVRVGVDFTCCAPPVQVGRLLLVTADACRVVDEDKELLALRGRAAGGRLLLATADACRVVGEDKELLLARTLPAGTAAAGWLRLICGVVDADVLMAGPAMVVVANAAVSPVPTNASSALRAGVHSGS